MKQTGKLLCIAGKMACPTHPGLDVADCQEDSRLRHDLVVRFTRTASVGKLSKRPAGRLTSAQLPVHRMLATEKEIEKARQLLERSFSPRLREEVAILDEAEYQKSGQHCTCGNMLDSPKSLKHLIFEREAPGKPWHYVGSGQA